MREETKKKAKFLLNFFKDAFSQTYVINHNTFLEILK